MIGPTYWQILAERAPLGGELDGLSAIQDRLDDVRSEEGEAEYAAHVSPRNVFCRHYNTVGPHSALGYRPPAPQTVIVQRDDPPFAIEGLPADRPFRQSTTNENQRVVPSRGQVTNSSEIYELAQISTRQALVRSHA